MSDLESRVERLLRAAPTRRAPRSLEQRVLREIARREALPWWRRSFSRWPRFAQACLAVISILAIVAVLGADLSWPDGAFTGGGMPAAAGSLLIAWLEPARTLLETARNLDASVMRLVPTGWLYGAMAAAALLYAALFGLGAAAYRTLYLQPTSDDLGS